MNVWGGCDPARRRSTSRISGAHIVLRNNMEALPEWRGRQFGRMNREVAKSQKTMERMLANALRQMGVTGGCRAERSNMILTQDAGEETLVVGMETRVATDCSKLVNVG